MSTETVTKPKTITKPKLHDGSGNDDERLRHIVEKKRRDSDSRSFKKIALCGAKIRDVHVEQNGEICQECVDELNRREG